jgi:hypothetical protein
MRIAPASLILVVASVLPASAQVGDPGVVPRGSAARLANAPEVRKRLGLAPEYQNVRGVENLKIAVLDYGFAGLETGRRYLPQNTVVIQDYDAEFVRRYKLGDPEYRKPLDPANSHGRIMAQIVWAVTGSNPKGPQFFLLNANGPTMLRRAVRFAIDQKVDLILFSGAFEGAGNGDGRGPINRIVAEALAADILWINAAGNYGHRVYNGPVRIDRDGYLRFRDGADGTALRFRNRLDENTITVTLTWNDYRDQEDAGTTKDLDLILEDRFGKRLEASEKKQVAGDKSTGPDESRNPRERVVLTDLPATADLFRIRVRAKSSNFGPDDRIRVLITSSRQSYIDPETGNVEDAVTFYDATGKGELYPPADHPLVLTVGDSSPATSVGPTADHRVKPDVILPDSRAFFSDGEVTSGSSNAAAYLAGVVAILKAAEPGLRTRHLLRLARQETVVRTSAYGSQTTMPAESSLKRETLPSPSASQSMGRLTITGPRGNKLVIPIPHRSDSTAPASTSGGTRASETLPPPFSKAPASDAPALEKRVWQTPSRARLAEVVRTDR